MGFWANGAERMRITASGGISFGTTGTAYGSSGQILQSNGDAAPTWVSPGGITGVNADQVRTIAQTANASYFPAFVDSNNASNAYELVYTTSSFAINPQSGNVGIGTSTPSVKLHVVGASIIANSASIDPDSYANTVVAGGISFPNGWGVGSAVGGNAGTGDSWALGHNGGGLYFGIGNGVAANTQQTYIQMMPNRDLYFVPTSGNVGIGLTTLTEKFEVNGSINVSTASSNNFATGNQRGFMDYVPASTQVRVGHLSGASGSTTGILTLLTNGTERLRITSLGGISFGASGTAYGTSGQILNSNGNAAPTWVNQNTIASGQVSTVLQTASASYFPTFVDANNATATAESFYTTSSFVINPQSGNVGINNNAPYTGLHVASGHIITNVADTAATDSASDSKNAGFGFKVALGTVLGALINTTANGNWGADINFNVRNSGGGTFPATSAMIVRSGGTVSVGYASAQTNGLLQVAGGIGIAANSIVRQATNGDGGTLKFYGTQFVAGQNNSGSYGYTGGAGIASVSPSASYVTLDVGGQGTGNSHRLKVVNDGTGITGYLYYGQEGGSTATLYANVATGNVGIGTTSPTAKLHVSGNTIITGNAVIGATTTTNKFEVAGLAGQLFSVSDSFTGTIFSVNDVSGIPSIEVLDTGLIKMAQYNGAVAIGTGTITSSTAELSVYGMLYTLGSQGEIRASSEITAYFSSDRRLKENIKLIENPITIIDQIRGVTFDWTDEHMARRGGEDGYFVRKHDIGVIAQEVQAVLPELVGTREDGYLAVKYEKMVPLLIEAIKEQQKTIDILIKDLADVKEFINDLKNKNGI
jgi:hypothetical protein